MRIQIWGSIQLHPQHFIKLPEAYYYPYVLTDATSSSASTPRTPFSAATPQNVLDLFSFIYPKIYVMSLASITRLSFFSRRLPMDYLKHLLPGTVDFAENSKLLDGHSHGLIAASGTSGLLQLNTMLPLAETSTKLHFNDKAYHPTMTVCPLSVFAASMLMISCSVELDPCSTDTCPNSWQHCHLESLEVDSSSTVAPSMNRRLMALSKQLRRSTLNPSPLLILNNTNSVALIYLLPP